MGTRIHELGLIHTGGGTLMCNATRSKWDLLLSMGVFILLTSNIKGKTFQFVPTWRRASCVNYIGLKCTDVLRTHTQCGCPESTQLPPQLPADSRMKLPNRKKSWPPYLGPGLQHDELDHHCGQGQQQHHHVNERVQLQTETPIAFQFSH